MSSLAPSPETLVKIEVLDTVGLEAVRSPSPAASGEIFVDKISNSDDEDIMTRVRRNNRNASGYAAHLSYALSSNGSYDIQEPTRATAIEHNPQSTYDQSERSARSGLYGVPQCNPYYDATDKDNQSVSPFVRGNDTSLLDDSNETTHRNLTSPTEAVPASYSRAAFTAQRRPDAPSRHMSSHPQQLRQPSLGVTPMLSSFDAAMLRPQLLDRSSQDRPMLPPPNKTLGEHQSSVQPRRVAFTVHSSNVTAREDQTFSHHVGSPLVPNLQGGTDEQFSHYTSSNTSKHTTTPPRSQPKKRTRDGFLTAFVLQYGELPYQTTKCIKMPPREDLEPGQDPPEPTEDNLPYGDTEDYRSSMTIYWLDEKEFTYSQASRLYRQKFPNDSLSDDVLRKRHLRSLHRLAKRYGVKPITEIKTPGKAVLRRGQQAGARYNNTIVPATAIQVGPNARSQTTTPVEQQLPHSERQPSAKACPKRVSRLQATRAFRLACIVVWKDSLGVSYDQIQEKLAEDFDWKLSTTTIQKLYYSERGRVYDTDRTVIECAESDLDGQTTAEKVAEEGDEHDTAGGNVYL